MPAACDFKFAAEDDEQAWFAARPARRACFATRLARTWVLPARPASCFDASSTSRRRRPVARQRLKQCVPARACETDVLVVNRATWTAEPDGAERDERAPAPSAGAFYPCTGTRARRGRWRSTSFPRNGTLVAGFGSRWRISRVRDRAPRVDLASPRASWWTGWGCYHPLDPQARDDVREPPGRADNCGSQRVPVRTWDWRGNATLDRARSRRRNSPASPSCTTCTSACCCARTRRAATCCPAAASAAAVAVQAN